MINHTTLIITGLKRTQKTLNILRTTQDFYTHSTAVKRLLGVQYEVWWLARTISALYSAFAGSIIHNVRAVTRPLLREERSFERRVKENPTLDLFSLLLAVLLGTSWCYLSVSDWIKGGAGALMPLTPIFNILVRFSPFLPGTGMIWQLSL